jgi:predicted kinase
LDASFARQIDRRRLLRLAREMGADCCIVECWAPDEVLRTRLRQREYLPTSISDARVEILDQFRRDFEPLDADEGLCAVRVDTTQSLDQCVQQALAVIQEQKA